MKNTRMLVAIFIAALLLQACSVSYLQLRNELKEKPSPAYVQPCNGKFFISIEGYRKRADVGKMYLDPIYEDRLQEYIKATQKIIGEKRCAVNYVEHEEEANLKIRIVKSGYRGAAPQDWLTGLSFGLIPSWKTEEDAYNYFFESVSIKREYRYSVDQKTFAHLILFPIFWVTFITLDDMADYKKALTNFLENS